MKFHPHKSVAASIALKVFLSCARTLFCCARSCPLLLAHCSMVRIVKMAVESNIMKTPVMVSSSAWQNQSVIRPVFPCLMKPVSCIECKAVSAE